MPRCFWRWVCKENSCAQDTGRNPSWEKISALSILDPPSQWAGLCQGNRNRGNLGRNLPCRKWKSLKTSDFAGAEAAGQERGREDDHSKVYSKRTVILLKIKLVLVQQHPICKHLSSIQCGISEPSCPSYVQESSQPCIPQQSHTSQLCASAPTP